ncbi:MAG TPA: phosphatase PAP2 family protein, partial [Dehalococcoidia bacterium]|nr:phosphatase PAP2 family protein [Dehalococcoidia bacterium]
MEACLVALGFLAYFAVRGAVIDRPEAAYDHAVDLILLQQRLGIFWEDDIQEWVSDKLFLVQSFNIIYFWLHFPLIIVFGIWLYFTQRGKYTLLRDAFLISGALALIVYWFYPMAPPRELPELAGRFDPNAPVFVRGFVDTMQAYLGYAYDTQSTRAFVNPYAAMPSLHFGWDMLLGIGLVWAAWGSRWVWLLTPIGISLPVLQVFAITVTGNHFFLDAAAGAAVSLAGLPIAIALSRWAYPWLAERIRRMPWPLVRRLFLAEPDLRRE